MYLSDDPTQPNNSGGTPPYREAMQQTERGMYEDYQRACDGVRVLEFLRRGEPSDPVVFWEQVIKWLPKLFQIKRDGEQRVRAGTMTRRDFERDLRTQIHHVFPSGYALGTEDQELAKARCALAKARWQKQARMTPRDLRTPAGASLHGFFAEARGAEERIMEGDFGKVLNVLAGPSPWQTFIAPNLAIARQHQASRPFRVVDFKQFAATMQALGDSGDTAHIPGVTDKRTGIITMQEWFGVNSHATFLGAALHETVHMVSHPPTQGRSTTLGFSIFGEGLSEGLTECVTIDILRTQKIALARKEWQGHLPRLQVAIALLLPLGVPMLGDVLFRGNFQPFMRLMHQTYSLQGWEEIKRLTTQNKPQQAIQRMNQLRVQQQRSAQQVQQRQPVRARP